MTSAVDAELARQAAAASERVVEANEAAREAIRQNLLRAETQRGSEQTLRSGSAPTRPALVPQVEPTDISYTLVICTLIALLVGAVAFVFGRSTARKGQKQSER